MANYKLLQDEVSVDPLGLGYSTMTDEEVANRLNLEDQPHPNPVFSSGQVFEGIDITEYKNLGAGARARVNAILRLGADVYVGPGTRGREFLIDAFGADSTTITNLAAMLPKVSRVWVIGFGRPATTADIGRVR